MKLTAEQIEKIKIFFSDKPVKKAYVFGSYARGDANEKSDIDILVELDYSKHIGLGFAGLWLSLKSILKKEVDLIPSDSVYSALKPFIEKDKLLIYERSEK